MSRRNEVLKNFLKYEEETQHRVKHGIELYRKGFATLKVVDKDGNPVSGVKFEAKLKKHEFLHGANIFMLDEFDTEEYIRVDRFNQDRTISLLSYYIERKGQTYYVVIYENSQAIFRTVPAEHVEIIKYMLKEHTNY